ncbi:MAG: hypothetical protein IKJ01_02010, partial [Lachnospiraceae bacterium]|nr:hypothetical protein [Lachnospiraceae bacterium]
MLHIQYISQNTYHNGEKVFDKKEKIVCFLCEFFPNGTKKNDLIHNQMVCRYLKEVWNIEFVDDYCVKIDEKVQCMTWLPWNVQLAVQIIYDSQYHIPIVLTQFIPDMESLVW